jgi:hypothetical protein
MKKVRDGISVVALALVLAVGMMALMSPRQAAFGRAEGDGKSGGPRYTVIETQGFNLLVTDNAANKLYYYATDKDAPVAAPLKLRASLDLSQVGKDEINIKVINLEKMREKEKK